MPRVADQGAFTLKISSNTKRLLMIGAGIVLVFLVGYISYRWCLGKLVDHQKYQAVMLTSGQVYFGKMENPWSVYIRLTDVFYLQSKDGEPMHDLSRIGTGDITLIKLGKEVHAPTDKMEINREQVLFIQDLTDDSKVVKAIKDFKGK